VEIVVRQHFSQPLEFEVIIRNSHQFLIARKIARRKFNQLLQTCQNKKRNLL
jgi:hypothetical protein